MPISLRPRTNTRPDTLPEGGGRSTFTVEARSPGVASDARFTFKLDAGDGYEWSTGGTEVEEGAKLGTTWGNHEFDLTMRQVSTTGARLLFVTVEGVLVDANGSATSRPKTSVARLKIEPDKAEGQ